MGYHRRIIKKGEIGKFSKIEEEFNELKDGIEQENKILQIVELSDLVGAIEEFAIEEFGLTLDDVIQFSNLTKQAFKDGSRT
jgi:hypothetical protein